MLIRKGVGAFAVTITLASHAVQAQDNPSQLLFGDTHLHTSFSTDAYIAGNRDATPDVAYRFAKGESVVHPYHRARVQLHDPLDFLAVSDHAESMGVVGEIHQNGVNRDGVSLWGKISGWVKVQLFRRIIEEPGEATRYFTSSLPEPLIESGDTRDPIAVSGGGGIRALSGGGLLPPEVAADIKASKWNISMDSASLHNEPGKFTTLVGWEWTQTPMGVNLHRVIVSDVDPQKAKNFSPLGTDEAPYPEELWAWLDKTSVEQNANFISIPHNSNVSKGYMFAETTLKGEPIGADYAKLRVKWEPIVEITQIKGDSEVHHSLSPDDEFADFENFPTYIQKMPNFQPLVPNKGDFVRSALKTGLEIENKVGVNPFKLGFIGSTDSHVSTSSAEEDNFHGKLAYDSTPGTKKNTVDDEIPEGSVWADGWDMSASGLAAVWARENTREEIIAAFARRETYATTGPRMRVRVFGGWNFTPEDLEAADMAAVGYSKGVPMGGDLTAAPDGQRPSFLIQAVQGPRDASLDRVQVIKGWLDANGVAQEKIYDVVWAGDRKPNGDGKIPAVENTVNLRTGAVDNSVGASELVSVWQDPDFDASQRAFYYVRVLQIPTLRHSVYDANALGVEHDADKPKTIQERAYTSPIWYTPAA